MKRAPWETEHELSASAFANVLERRFVEFVRPKVEALTPGWDYLVFRVDDDWVFKVPKRQEIVSRMRQEVSLVTALPPLPVAIPRPTFHGVAADDLRFPFFGYPYLDGLFASDPSVDPAPVIEAALALLDTLHGIVPPFAVEGKRQAQWERRLEELAEVQKRYPEFADSFTFLTAHKPQAPEAQSLLHGDLGPNHLLLNPTTHQLTGVIDWADATRGDPAQDLIALILWSPSITTSVFNRHGGDSEELRRAYAYGLITGLEILGEHDRWNPTALKGWHDTLLRVQAAITE